MTQTTATRSNGEQQPTSNQNSMVVDNKSLRATAEKVKPSYKHIPHSQKPPHLVAKRNARERRRVQAVNQAFYKLRKSVPIENRNKRVSKVKTLQRAIDYIRKLERILAEDGEEQPSGSTTRGESSCIELPEPASGGTVTRSNVRPDQDELVSNSKGCRSRLESQSVVAARAQTTYVSTNRKGSTRSRKQQSQSSSKNKQLAHTMPSQAEQQQINQVARVQQRRTMQHDMAGFGISAMVPRQEDNNYTVCMKSATTMAANSGPFDSVSSNPALVSYGKSSGRDVGPSPTANHQHFSSNTNHYGQYYTESPTSSNQLIVESLSSQQHQQYAYGNHPQFPSNGFQGCEISSSSLMTNGPLYGNYLQGGYQYEAVDSDRAALSLGSNQQQRLVNHDSFNKPVESPATTRTTVGQQRYHQSALVATEAPAQHYQDRASNDPASNGHIEECNKTAQAKKMILLENANLINTAQQLEQQQQHTQDDKLADAYRKQHEIGTATSMPADSTSSAAVKDAPDKGLVSSKSTRSPAASFCSSSPTSMSSSTTTIKSLDLSGSGIFSSASMNGSDKSPTTSINTPVICRQRKSGHESGAHSTTGRGNFVRRQAGENTTDGQQQVNNYDGNELPGYAAAHLLYETPPSNRSITVDYSRVNQNQLRQLGAERTIKLAEGKSHSAASLHASSSATNNLELLQARHRSGSRSSSTISPDPAQQLALVGGNYLANNNLHGNDQNTGQLFQHHPAHYNYQQHDHYHQIQHHNHNSHHQNPGQQQLQQPLYQGQHFLGNLQSGHQQLNSNHLNDHNNHHHLQSDSFPSGLRQPNANTLELVTASNIVPHQQLERLVASGSTTSITAPPAQYTVQPL